MISMNLDRAYSQGHRVQGHNQRVLRVFNMPMSSGEENKLLAGYMI